MRLLTTIVFIGVLAQSVGAEVGKEVMVCDQLNRCHCEIAHNHVPCSAEWKADLSGGVLLTCEQRMRAAMRAMDIELQAINPKDSRETRFGTMSIIHIQTKTREQWNQTMRECVQNVQQP